MSEARFNTKKNANVILKCWSVSPFRWHRNRYKCAYCDLDYTESYHLRDHVQECSQNFTIKDIYKKFKEMSMINIDITEAKCRFCSVPLKDINHMKLHISEHNMVLNSEHPDGVIPFELDKNSWRCLSCGKEFNNFLKLYGHMNSHYQHYVCDVCGKGFMTAYRLRKHCEVHVSGSFPCDICGQVFTSRAGREYHKSNVHSKTPRYECPQCYIRFEDYYARMRHLNEQHRVKEVVYKCGHCELVFRTSSKRAAHVRAAHLSLQRNFICSQCDGKFKSACGLKAHMTKHTGDRDYNCEICGKTLALKASLLRHMRLHDKLNHPCKLCSRVFIYNSGLVRHVKECHLKNSVMPKINILNVT